MARAKCSYRTQAVRLPKAIAFPEHIKRVEVIAVGQARIITPVGASWYSWFEGPDITADFMSDREQPSEQEQ
ncbi:type II toxin-antitoxin system VapB family antitoxin [Nitrincola sp. MINF-07-Sa-05]|uniref:type II toxin-antitoxin system VapB family antitoxin n=1 Tax=Nitrincola salilacus TaxID=3400273 RepID=UPI003917C736